MGTHADRPSVPDDTDDAALWADPLWVALERARTALIDDPRLLTEKKPEWEGGLNILEINRLAAETGLKHVFSADEITEHGLVVARSLTVYHPGPRDPVVVETWSRYGVVVLRSKVRRAIALLRAWQSARAEQVLAARVGGPEARRPLTNRPEDLAFRAYWAWRAGQTQGDVADMLSTPNRAIRQSWVSRACARVQKYLDAGGLPPNLMGLPAQRERDVTMDPAAMGLGPRRDRRVRKRGGRTE